MTMHLKAALTSQMVEIFIQDSSATDGSGLTGLVYNSAGLTAKYRRSGVASDTTITLADATVGTYTSGGFKEVGNGYYELGIPDAAITSGADWVVIKLYGATNMAPVALRIQLDAVATEVWESTRTDYDTSATFGETINKLDIWGGIYASVNDGSPTASGFITTLTETANDYWKGAVCRFSQPGDAALPYQARKVTGYNGTTKALSFADEPFTSAPSNGDDFYLIPDVEDTLTQVEDAVWDATRSSHVAAGTMGQIGFFIGFEGLVTSGGSPTETQFDTDLDFVTFGSEGYVSMMCMFITGNAAGQAGVVDSTIGTFSTLVLARGLGVAPAVGDKFILIPTGGLAQGSIAQQVWDHQYGDQTFKASDALKVIAAACAGKISGMDTLAPLFRDIADQTDRITATTDKFGNRSAITLDTSDV